MEALLNRFPEVTAVFCSNDRLALHALEYAVGRGIKVPEDLSFVGFDNIDASALCSPALTTINQDFYNMGLVAAETLYRRIRSHSAANQPCPQRLRLEPSLLVRASSSRPRTEPLVARKSQRSKLTPPP
jgi:LacI family transcriptional regulator